jgi:hypothetical protein
LLHVRHWRIPPRAEFVETAIFTRQVTTLLDDTTYARVQVQLAAKPTAGRVMQGTGGLRKLRVAAHGHGKRGGARIIYVVLQTRDQIGTPLAYPALFTTPSAASSPSSRLASFVLAAHCGALALRKLHRFASLRCSERVRNSLRKPSFRDEVS